MNELIESALDVFRNAGDDEPSRPVDVTAPARSMADDMAEAGFCAAGQPARRRLARRGRPAAGAGNEDGGSGYLTV